MVDVTLVNRTPELASLARLKYDKVREKSLLLLPERVVILNETAASILALCDGVQTIHRIADQLRTSLQSEASSEETLPDVKTMEADITAFVEEMADQGWVVLH